MRSDGFLLMNIKSSIVETIGDTSPPFVLSVVKIKKRG